MSLSPGSLRFARRGASVRFATPVKDGRNMLKRFLLASSLCLVWATCQAIPSAAEPSAAPALTPAGPAAAPGAPSNGVQLMWMVYISGIKIGLVGLKTNFAPGSYSSASMLKTGGIIGAFYNSRIEANSIGAVSGQMLRPRNYAADANSNKRQKTQLAYSAKGIELFADPAYNTERFPVTDEQKRDTLDPVSAMTFAISGLSVDAQHPCGGGLHVFDGARRYDVDFKYIANENLTADEDGYSGAAVKCEVIYTQVAGFKPSVNQGSKTYPIYVWGAVFETKQAGPMKRFVVPVKIMTETSYGTAKAIARKITVDGTQRTN